MRVPLVIALAAGLIAPSVASGQSSQEFGGADGKVNTDAEVRAVVRAAKRERDPSIVTQLPAKQRELVMERGLTPDGPPESGVGEPPPEDDESLAHMALLREITAYCRQRSHVGVTLWRYNSRCAGRTAVTGSCRQPIGSGRATSRRRGSS